MNQKIFAANWKLFKTPQETRDFFQAWNRAYTPKNLEKIVFFPPATSLEATSEMLKSSQCEFGSQNCYFEGKGAFTGETSASVVKALSGKWILLGHSERRTLFAETDELIQKKLRFVQDQGLVPMLCIGETMQERGDMQIEQVLRRQLSEGLKLADSARDLAIAYEPVWAIGTGKVATPEMVEEAHVIVRRILGELKFSTPVQILYGGSVKPDNAKTMINLLNVDGFLVGGASLEVSSFLEIVG